MTVPLKIFGTKAFGLRSGLLLAAILPPVQCALAAPTLPTADSLPLDLFSTPPGLEVTLWAYSPMLRNPTNIDIDKDGRVWVAEGVNYRRHYDRQPAGDRIVVLQDINGDGKADRSHVFVQEPFLRAPMGVAVLDNKIVVSMTPDLVVYTDVDRNLIYDPAVDKREVLLTGFNGRIHDHSLHAVTFGPDGQWYWNAGNCGAVFTDKSGRTFRIGSPYDPYYGQRKAGDFNWNPREIAGQKSDDGRVYVGGFAARMNPDGTGVYIIGQNFRNSYEQTVTSFGDVFYNANDDPPACYTGFLMEFGNAGFCSFDGQRTWMADRRPGQSIAVAEWRQEDPGAMPVGDLYGGGAPTGIAYYENGALGRKFEGLLLSCEPARNTVFGYLPQPEGAGFNLQRFDFLTANKEGQFAGADFKGGDASVTHELKTFFRPSDVCVGPDGAVYVADWFDSRVGGHQDLDESLVGAIYRIAPRNFKPEIPALNLSTVSGEIEALKSPAVNVRSLGYTRLKARGEGAVPAVEKLLQDRNPFFQARAIWLLSQLGPKGIARVEPMLKNGNPQLRVTAFRALSRAGRDMTRIVSRLAKDSSPGVRREVALAMRDLPAAQSTEILLALAKQYDGKDRWYLEALGTGGTGKETELYNRAHESLGRANPERWSRAFATLAWRLHPEASTAAFKTRALSKTLSTEDRKAALVALAYIGSRDAALAILEVAEQSAGPVQVDALWWLLNRKDNLWKDYDLNEALKKCGLYDPEAINLVSVSTPAPPETKLPSVGELLKIKGDKARGQSVATACLTCHKIKEDGVEFGPDLTLFARAQTREVVLQSLINPSAEIAHGFDGTEIVTRDGLVIHGIVLADGDPVAVVSQGGVIQTVPRARIQSQQPLRRSLMLSADQMGLGPKELADLLAYLRSL